MVPLRSIRQLGLSQGHSDGPAFHLIAVPVLTTDLNASDLRSVHKSNEH